MPHVSILITAYNAEPWLGETLRSALDQTWRDLEVVLVDDGSTDGTLAVAQGFDDDRLRVITGPNRGACAARNTAIAHARGAFIQFLDADDLLSPNKIEAQLRCLEQEPEGTVATCAWSRFRTGHLAEAELIPQPDWKDFDPATDWLVQAWSGGGTMPTFTWLVPRAIVEAAGPWSEDLLINQDGEYFARILTHTARLRFCREAEAYYRSGLPGSVSQRRGEDAGRSLFRSYELCEEHLFAVDRSPAARRAVASLWQSFMFRVYPALPDLVAEAEARVEALGGGNMKASVGGVLKPVRDAVGWKPTLRVYRLYQHLRRMWGSA